MRTAPLLVAFLCSPLLAQAPAKGAAPSAPVAPTSPPGLREVVFDEPGDGSLWASAPGWKAEFAPGHCTFVPYFGGSAPRDFPLDFRLQSVTVGGEALQLVDPIPSRDGTVVTFDRGAVREVYELGLAGIEQKFRFDQLPGRGALDFTIATTSDLQPRATAAGLRFGNEFGGVTYSRAVAIDARGERCELATAWRDGAIHFTVPAAFVAAAAMPLWIDPKITPTLPVGGPGYPVSGTDLAFDPSANEYQCVWSVAFSQTDHDIYLQRLDATFAPIGTTLTIDSTTESWRAPNIANLNLYDRFLVVADAAAAGVDFVGARITQAGSSSPAGPKFQIEGPTAQGNLGLGAGAPDVGGDPVLAGPTYWTVVFESYPGQDADVWFRQVRSDGTLVGNAPTAVATTPQRESRPRISKTDGVAPASSQAWGLTYLVTYTEFWGGSITWNGQWIATPRFLALGGNVHSTCDISSPTDDRGGREFLLVRDGSLVNTDLDVFGTVLDRAMNVVVPERDLSVIALSPTEAAKPQARPMVDCDGTRFAVGFQHVYGPADVDVHMATFMHADGNLGLVCHDEVAAASTTHNEAFHGLCATHSAGGAPIHYALAWAREVSSSVAMIEGALYDGRLAAPEFTTRTTGCGGITLAHQGVFAPGSSITFTITGATGLPGFVAGLPVTLPIPGCGGCLQGVYGSTLITNALTVNVPAAAGFVGITFAFQGFDLGAGPCFGAVRLTDTIDATIR